MCLETSVSSLTLAVGIIRHSAQAQRPGCSFFAGSKPSLALETSSGAQWWPVLTSEWFLLAHCIFKRPSIGGSPIIQSKPFLSLRSLVYSRLFCAPPLNELFMPGAVPGHFLQMPLLCAYCVFILSHVGKYQLSLEVEAWGASGRNKCPAFARSASGLRCCAELVK